MFDVESDDLQDVLGECVLEGRVTCRGCGLLLDCDTDHCPECGWHNPARDVM